MVRPKKQPGTSRNKPLQVRIFPSELAGFKAAAEAAGLSLSGWARERLRAAARKEMADLGRPEPF